MGLDVKDFLNARHATLSLIFGFLLGALAAVGTFRWGELSIGIEGALARSIAAVAAALLVALSVYLHRGDSATATPPKHITDDPRFWRELWRVMPPAFVKEQYSDISEVHKHLLVTDSLHTFQGPSGESLLSPTTRAAIAEDHFDGDVKALSRGIWWQLEVCEANGSAIPRRILTLKRRFRVGERTFIFGTCLPVEMALPQNTTVVDVRMWNQHPLFIPVVGAAQESIPIAVGKEWNRVEARRAGVS